MNEDKATRYHRLRRRASALALALDAVLLSGLLVSGASAFLRDAAGALAGPRPALVVLAYVLMLAVVHEAVSLPLGLYRGFVLERRYGLSREALGGWIRDHAKASGVGLLFGGLAASVTYLLLRTTPERWWVIAAAVFSAATVLLAQLSPIVLLPAFYRVTPLARPSLSDRLVALAERAGSRVLGVYEWHLGDRTRRANAALVGIGRTRRILLSDTLLAEYSDDEIEAVLAHELGHHVHHDIWSAIGIETVLIFLGFFLADRALAGFGPLFHLAGPADVAGLPLLLLASGLVSVGLLPIANLMSRRHERRADRFALALTARPAAFVSAMRRLASQNLAEEHPPLIVRLLFSTHPPIRERLAAAAGAGVAATER